MTRRIKRQKDSAPHMNLHHDRYHCYGTTVFQPELVRDPPPTRCLSRRDSLSNPAKRLEIDRNSQFDQGYELATGGSSSQDDMAYRSGMRERGAVEEEEKEARGRQQQQATRTPLSSFRKWPVALVYYTKNTHTQPLAPFRRQKCLAGLRSTRDGNLGEPGVPPSRGVVDLLAGPHPQWRKQNLAAAGEQQASRQSA